MEIVDKANELISKMLKHQRYDPSVDLGKNKTKRAIECALISVNEIIDFMIVLKWDIENNGNVIYWQEVKEELERLKNLHA